MRVLFVMGAGVAGVLLAAYAGLSSGSERDRLCTHGYAKSQRLAERDYYSVARLVYARDGVAWSERKNYTLDHIVPLCAGGTNELSNLQLQRPDEARIKDDMEIRACKLICADKVDPPIARGWFSDWRANYNMVMEIRP